MTKTTGQRKQSRAEIQRRYRERKKSENPDAYLQKERDRWYARRRCGKVKTVGDLTERERRCTRKRWRERQHESRMRHRIAATTTPPVTPDRDEERDGDASSQRRRGRKAKKRRDAASYRMIIKLKESLAVAKRGKERYRKKFERERKKCRQPARGSAVLSDQTTPRSKTRQMLSSCSVTPSVKKTLLFHNALIDDMRHSTGRNVTTEKRRRLTSRVISGKILKRYRLGTLAKKRGIALSSIPEVGDGQCAQLDSTRRKVRSDAVDQHTVELIGDFFNRDDNSRLTTGRKDTVTKHKVRMQKRLLSDTMCNLHEKFCSEYSSNAVSYTTFTRYRPFWVRIPNEKDRQTCLCKKHHNIQLKADKLFHLQVIDKKNAEELLYQQVCDINKHECMSRECDECENKRVQFRDNVDETHTTVWSEWTVQKESYEKDGQVQTTKRTAKVNKKGTVGELKTVFSEEMTKFGEHVFKIRHQFRQYRDLKETLTNEEVVVHVDYSENWTAKYSEEIQSVHFGASQQQVTLHTGVVYIAHDHWSFASISPSLYHGPEAVWAHLQPVLQEIQQRHPSVKVVHMYTDGPTTQYRNKMNFYLFCTCIFDLGFDQGTWNLFEAGHGKGAPDAVGGTIKRLADRMVANGKDIPTAESLFQALSSCNSAIKLFYVDETEIASVRLMCPSNLKTVKGTLQIHQLWTEERNNIWHRKLSCFCSKPARCSCYAITRVKFPSAEEPRSDAVDHASKPTDICSSDAASTLHPTDVEQVTAATGHAEAAAECSVSVDSSSLDPNVVGASAGKGPVCMSVQDFYCRSRPKILRVTTVQPTTASRKRRVNKPKRYQ